MKHWTLAAIVSVGVGVLLAACGGNPCSENPAAPSCVADSAPSALTITSSTDVLKVETTFTFAGTALHHDGTVVSIHQWSSDNAQVATADVASGKVTGVANGTAAIVGEHDGVRVTKKLRVVPDYERSWSGDYQTTACHESGDFMGFCQEFPVGATLPMSLHLTQPQASVDGTFNLGQLSAGVHGPIDDAGDLSLGDATIRAEDATIRLCGWALAVTPSGDLRGVFRTTWTCRGAAGEAGYNAQLRFVRRTAGMPSLPASQSILARTWRDVVPVVLAR